MKIIVPERYNYIGVFLTLRCNLKCSYCINKYSTFKNREELPPEVWINFLNNLDIPEGLVITLEGGEPTLHKGFYEILKNVKSPVDMLTNLQFDVDAFTNEIDPRFFNHGRKKGYKSIRVSYHDQDQNELLDKAVRLQEAGFNVGVFSINAPDKIEKNMEMAERARKVQIYFFTKDYLGVKDGRLFGYYQYPEAVNGQKKTVSCRIKELLIAPNGYCFRCHRDLYASENAIGNIQEDFVIKDIFRNCDNYGDCSPCDVKLKTNRFLEMGSCSVEIKDV